MATVLPAVVKNRVITALKRDVDIRPNSDPSKAAVKEYFHISTKEQLREFFITQLDDPDFVAEIESLIQAAPINKEYINIDNDDWALLSVYCNGNVPVFVYYNKVTNEMKEDSEFADGLDYHPCMDGFD